MDEQTQPSQAQSESSTLKSERLLFQWRAPARPFKKRTKEFFTTVLAIAFLISVIMFFIEGALPVAVVIAIVFLTYVLSSVPPEEVEHKITSRGVYFAEKRRGWDEFTRFWFTRRFENDLLILETIAFPGRIEMVIGPADREELRRVLEEYLPYEEAEPNFLDKSAAWFSKRIPLES